MSVAALMLVKDELDIVEHVVRHLSWNVDEILVLDNGSSDGTAELLRELARELPLIVNHDPEVGYRQSEKTTWLAQVARLHGHAWVLPCDADEFWYQPSGMPIREFLQGVAPDVQVIAAQMFNHIPTALDEPEEPSPFRRLRWRLRGPGALPKVCARTDPSLVIHMGNHGCTLNGTMLTTGGLVIRHFSWRSEQQYVRKIINGARAYAATDLPETTGAHWRMFGNPPNEEAVADHFYRWFYSLDPAANDNLIYDPTPFVRWPEPEPEDVEPDE